MMSELMKVIVNGDEITERPYTKEELAQHEKDKTQADALVAELSKKEAEEKAKRQALLNKLGISEEEARLLLG